MDAVATIVKTPAELAAVLTEKKDSFVVTSLLATTMAPFDRIMEEHPNRGQTLGMFGNLTIDAFRDIAVVINMMGEEHISLPMLYTLYTDYFIDVKSIDKIVFTRK